MLRGTEKAAQVHCFTCQAEWARDADMRMASRGRDSAWGEGHCRCASVCRLHG